MRSLAPRVVLAAVLAMTLAEKVSRLQAVPVDMHGAVLSFAVRNGWTAQEIASTPDSPLGKPITFRDAACERSGQIFLLHLSLQAAPMLDHAIPPDHTRRFVYLGRTWLTQDRWGMRVEWLKQRLLGLFGLGHYEVNETVLVIAEPNDCHVGDKVDWGPVWKQHASTGRADLSDT
jgi:predicted Rdx family selenoprotein